MRNSAPLKRLFAKAESGGGLDYVCTLLRVRGMTCGVPDPLLELRSLLQQSAVASDDGEGVAQYRSLLDMVDEPLSLVANLLDCAQGRPYNPLPFLHLDTGPFPHRVKATPAQMVQEVTCMAQGARRPSLARMILEAYREEVIRNCYCTELSVPLARVRVALQNCRSFLAALLELYFAARLGFREQPTRLYKLPRFTVLELLVDDEFGLNGFHLHFSNGEHATCTRGPESTECINVWWEDGVRYFVGDPDRLRDEWRVGERRLYEIGLPGRYNKLGEWKPIIYPVDFRSLEQEARSLSPDTKVQGVLFYMMCTGHRVIEFVVRGAIDLPAESITLGERFHLWKCPALDDASPWGENLCVYDGWFDLQATDPKYIRRAIAEIGIRVNRVAFAYNLPLDWRLKYTMRSDPQARVAPTEEELGILDSMLRSFPSANEGIILDAAIDWYNRGKASPNVFTAFLCYYIALESVAIAVAEGKGDFGLSYSRESKRQRKQQMVECISRKHKSIYSQDPIGFVNSAYLECVVGLKEKTRRVAELVFGARHEYLDLLFRKGPDRCSLSDIRGKLAHGKVTLLDYKHEELVWRRLHEIAAISKEFLTRLLFRSAPSDPVPSWHGRYVVSLWMGDPRATTAITPDASLLASTDWRIRPEWCD